MEPKGFYWGIDNHSLIGFLIGNETMAGSIVVAPFVLS